MTTKHYTYSDFLVALYRDYNRNPKEQRLGQYAFNLLKRIRPELADRISNTPNDPFYAKRIPEGFFSYLKENWD